MLSLAKVNIQKVLDKHKSFELKLLHIYDDIDVSIYEEVMVLNSMLSLAPLIEEFIWSKNYIHSQCWLNKIIIQFHIGRKMSLVSKLGHI